MAYARMLPCAVFDVRLPVARRHLELFKYSFGFLNVYPEFTEPASGGVEIIL